MGDVVHLAFTSADKDLKQAYDYAVKHLGAESAEKLVIKTFKNTGIPFEELPEDIKIGLAQSMLLETNLILSGDMDKEWQKVVKADKKINKNRTIVKWLLACILLEGILLVALV